MRLAAAHKRDTDTAPDTDTERACHSSVAAAAGTSIDWVAGKHRGKRVVVVAAAVAADLGWSMVVAVEAAARAEVEAAVAGSCLGLRRRRMDKEAEKWALVSLDPEVCNCKS